MPIEKHFNFINSPEMFKMKNTNLKLTKNIKLH
jgi:hypothetical protein